MQSRGWWFSIEIASQGGGVINLMAENPDNPQQSPLQNSHWPLIFGLLFLIYYFFTLGTTTQAGKISYSEFINKVEQQQVQSVSIQGLDVRGVYVGSGGDSVDGRPLSDFTVVLPVFADSEILDLMIENGVEIETISDQPSVWMNLVLGFLPWIFFIAVFIWISRRVRDGIGGGSGILSFGKSKARLYKVSEGGPNYSEVAGLENAKQDLMEIVDYLKNPQPYRDMGARIPKGILMMGAPGTGKTLLAKATASEAGVPFFSVSGSEFIEMYVGVGASRVRDMFKQAREQQPALIFIDEIDSVGRVRGTGIGGGNDEREQTLNQVLAEMDGFNPDEAVIVLAATNRPDVLDPALLRPGRFDRKIVLEMPQRDARVEILKVHSRGISLHEDVDLDEIAALTVGFSGADLANLINEAVLKTVREKRNEVTTGDLHEARDKIIMGAARSDLLNPTERDRIACHEAGHAITAYFSKHSDPVKKISIVPRGRALGMTEQIPTEDRHNLNQDYLEDRLSILMGGRTAEKLIFESVSTGAEDDLRQATKLARKMVAQWGMSDSLGPVGYTVSEEHPFLGREMTETKEFSETTATLMDEEVRDKLLKAEKKTEDLLVQHKVLLESLIKALLVDEVIEDRALEVIFTQSGSTG
jgi:cell division protease FtsH